MSMEQIPPELLDNIMRQLARAPAEHCYEASSWGLTALRNARLVCRDWNRAATGQLFRTVYLRHQSPPEDACYDSDSLEEADWEQRAIFQQWHSMVDCETVRKAARTVVVKTTPDGFPENVLTDVWSRWSETPAGEFKGFVDALGRLSELPNLEAVEVHFTDSCVGVEDENESWKDGFETRTSRQKAIRAVFEAIAKRQEGGDAKTTSVVTSVGLKNLQNVPDKDLESNTAFRKVMRDVHTFHLHVAVEYNEHGPDHDMSKVERREFEPQLQRGLLASLAGQLTILTLGFREDWGSMPGYFDGKGLQFPALKKLQLQEFVVSHDDHLDWVLRMPVLRELHLVNVRMMTHAVLDEQSLTDWNVRTHGWERLPTGSYGYKEESDGIFAYHGRWHHFFDRARAELKALEDFRITWDSSYQRYEDDETPWTTAHKIPADAEDGAKLSMHRYVTFDYGLLPSPFLSTNDDGDMEFGDNNPDPEAEREGEGWRDGPELNMAKQHQEEDEMAFKALLRETWARRQ